MLRGLSNRSTATQAARAANAAMVATTDVRIEPMRPEHAE